MAEKDGEVNVQIKLGADVSGGVQSRAELEKLRAKARQTSAESVSAFTKFRMAGNALHKTLGLVNSALMGFGVVSLIMPVVNAFKEWRDKANEAHEKTRKLIEDTDLKDAAQQVKDVATAYKDLTDAINRSSEARQRNNEVFNEEVRVRREAEDENLKADELDELSGVNANAEDADKQRQRIKDKYNARRAKMSAERKLQDVVFKRQDLQGQADQANTAADKLEDSLAADDEAIETLTKQAEQYEQYSKQYNYKDRQKKSFFHPTRRTDAGDEERKRQKKIAEDARKEVERLQAEKKKKEEQIEELRKKAAHALRLRDVLWTSVETSELGIENTAVESENQTAVNAAADKKEADKKAKEKATYDDAKKAIELLERQKSELEAKKLDRQSDKDAMGKYVSDAEGDYETAKLSGNKRSQKSAYSNLHKLQETARNVNHEADSAINALTEALNSVNTRLKAAQSAIKHASKQQSYAWSESPSGE